MTTDGVRTLVLIDSKNLVYRSHWVHRFLSSKGRCTSVLFGALKMIAAIAGRMPDTAFVFCWDGQGKTWRHELTKGVYKGNRSGGPNEDMLPAFPQIPILQKVLKEAGFRQFQYDNLECDDLIGILASAVVSKDFFERVIIYSTDKDFYQLVTNRIGVMRGYDPTQIEHVMYWKEVGEELGIEPSEWVKVKAMIGDPSDNIPKIQTGLGPKTAIKMIAAGLDPSLEEFKKHKWVPRQEFQFFASRWPVIRQNYALSKIICSPQDVHLSEGLREELGFMRTGLTKGSFLRDRKRVNDESFAAFTEFIIDYEMSELFGQRHLLWRLP
jgi:5'-3' exonuclease